MFPLIMNNKVLPTPSENGQTLCANCKSGKVEQDEMDFTAWSRILIENVTSSNKEWEESKQRDAELMQKIRDLTKQVNGQTKILLNFINKDRRRNKQRRFQQRRHFQQRHSHREDHSHKQDTSSKMQSYHVISSKNTQQKEEDIQKHSEPHRRPEQQLERNNLHDQKVNGDVQGMIQQHHTVSENAHMVVNTAEGTRPRNVNGTIITHVDRTDNERLIEIEMAEEENKPNLNCSTDSKQNCSQEEGTRPRIVNCTIIAHGDRNGNDGPIEIEMVEEETKPNLNCFTDSKQNCSQEHVGVPPNSKSSVATKRATSLKRENFTQSNVQIRMVPELSQEVSQCSNPQGLKIINLWPLQPLPTNRNSSGLLQLPIEPQHTNSHPEESYILLGPNNTRISKKAFEGINFENASQATRKLLMALFDRKTLATHSMTGKKSPAFKGKPFKQALDANIVSDIIFAVTRRSKVSNRDVRNAITTKCADENKMWKMKQSAAIQKQNKENMG